jgi:PAS domain S-box-containing protein
MSDSFYKEMWEKILTEKKSINFKMKNRNKNGELYDVELTVSPIVDNSGQIVYFVGMEIDKKIRP